MLQYTPIQSSYSPRAMQPPPTSLHDFDYPRFSTVDWVQGLGGDFQKLAFSSSPSGRFGRRPLTPPKSARASSRKPQLFNAAGSAPIMNDSNEFGARYDVYSQTATTPSSDSNITSAYAYIPQPYSQSQSTSRGVSRATSPMPYNQSAHQINSRANPVPNPIIHPFLQLPKTISSKSGSLAEFAAQITCLFWFESSTTLSSVEEGRQAQVLAHRLAPDATPSTGFLKWVATILSTTQVTQNVILLALLFVYRLKKQNPSVKGKTGSEYRLLTVALMLGNKFLDDNTYVNKTWAEVSGISVGEIHVMEVEFLSHMKYNLFTSKEEWDQWHKQLANFSDFFDKVSTHTYQTSPQRLLNRLPSLQLPIAMPSPPYSNNASPPYALSNSPSGTPYGTMSAVLPSMHSNHVSPASSLPDVDIRWNARKRSYDDAAQGAQEPQSKRAYIYNPYQNSEALSMGVSTPHLVPSNAVVGLPMPVLPVPVGQTIYSQAPMIGPTSIPNHRPVSMTSLPPFQWSNSAHMQPLLPLPQTTSRLNPQAVKRLPPYKNSSAIPSPVAPIMPSTAAHTTSQNQLSPSYFLTRRTSPYRPVRNISTLTVPASAGRFNHQPQHVSYDQMHWQPLGKNQNDVRTGRVPYLHREAWPQTDQVENWPSQYAGDI